MPPHPRRSLLHGLYVILDPSVVKGRSLVDALNDAAQAGARLFQYRDKTATGREAYLQATQLRRAAADVGALFLVNDRCDLARAVDADGVHLGQRDLPLPLARSIMGPEKLIGISTHTPEHVTDSIGQGADYLGFGPIFQTTTKSDHEQAVGVEGLTRIRRLTSLPIFAIGGVTLDRVESMTRAGADGVAVISAIWTSPDLADTVRQFIACLKQGRPPVPARPDH